MNSRFRELEKPVGVRKKDVVLMATVTSFDEIAFPTKSELRQFAELFTPLFHASSEEARRQAVAALSQCSNIPTAVALFIASQPIAIAAPFLASSPCLSDDLLIMIARTQGAAHARAIVRREALSPTVIDALVGMRHLDTPKSRTPAEHPKPAATTPDGERSGPSATAAAAASGPAAADDGRLEREEKLRGEIRRLAAHVNRPPADRLGLRTVTSLQEALLVRFARNREAGLLATTLADTLSSSRWLAERILLDISGRQLATTLVGVAMAPAEIAFVLKSLYPHLSRDEGGMSRAERLIESLDPIECEERVDTWRRADSYTFHSAGGEDPTTAPAKPQAIKPVAAILQSVDEHSRQVLKARQR
ncbi:DUF2336 domain-containing protein [Rhizobium cremeum]|uniref:DUF2336 domain-containing protein n=1 Tax=Rhizobium cremeum TaxID=2813827 RepID=UPI0039E01B09